MAEFEKNLEAGDAADGFGIPGRSESGREGSLEASQSELHSRERSRFEELKGKTFKSVDITNEGIALDSFGGGFSQEGGRRNTETEQGKY